MVLPRFREECVVAPTPSRLFNRTSNKSRRMSTADIGDGKMNIALLSLSLFHAVTNSFSVLVLQFLLLHGRISQ